MRFPRTFLRATAATAVSRLAIAILSVCLSVRLSVIRVDHSKSDKRNLKWRRPPSWIYHFVDFGHTIYFWWQKTTLLQNFYQSMSIGGWIITVCAKIQDGGRQHFRFYFCSIFWHACV